MCQEGLNLWVFVAVRRDVQTSYELRRRDTQECPRMSKMTLGVKWSQVQILSARPIESPPDLLRPVLPDVWFSLYALGTIFSRYLAVQAALVQSSSASICGIEFYRLILRGSGKPILR